MFPVVTGLVMKEISTECGPRMELGGERWASGGASNPACRGRASEETVESLEVKSSGLSLEAELWGAKHREWARK